jgi:peptidoglycan/LPS O-acetylase OafA/YrhL
MAALAGAGGERSGIVAGAFPPQASAMGWDYLAWCGVPALLIAFAALGGVLTLPGAHLINRAGDISYAVYLLHVPIAWFWLWVWPRVPGFDPGPWEYFGSVMLATVALGWLSMSGSSGR